MSDRPLPYGDDPSRYPYPPDYFSDPTFSSDYVNDPRMSSGYNNPYFSTSTTLDNNRYSGNPGWGSTCPTIPTFDPCSSNPGWGSTYSNQPIPPFDPCSGNPDWGSYVDTFQPTAYVQPYNSVPISAMVKSDYKAYLGNTSGYPPQSDPCSDYEAPSFDPYDTTTSDTGSEVSDALHVRSPDLQMRGTRVQTRRKSKKKGQHQWWIDVWLNIMKTPPKSSPRFVMDYFVCIDGYFRKGRKGGHGVIIRDNIGQPLVASAVVSSPISFLYHQVMGVFRAVELAVKYSLEYIQLFCNAKHVARLVNRAMASLNGCAIHTGEEVSFDVICKVCVQEYAKEDTDLIFPLLREVADNHSMFVMLSICKVSRISNKAADFLAKNGAPDREEMEPSMFPDELKEILCKDYEESEQYGLPASC